MFIYEKIILMVILAMSVIGCELLSLKEWSEYNKRRSERGVKCYEDENGYVYCEDKYGNRH